MGQGREGKKEKAGWPWDKTPVVWNNERKSSFCSLRRQMRRDDRRGPQAWNSRRVNKNCRFKPNPRHGFCSDGWKHGLNLSQNQTFWSCFQLFCTKYLKKISQKRWTAPPEFLWNQVLLPLIKVNHLTLYFLFFYKLLLNVVSGFRCSCKELSVYELQFVKKTGILCFI